MDLLVPPTFSESIEDGIRVDNEPVLVSQKDSVLVGQGSSFSVGCSASGLPKPTVRFIRDGLLITEGVTTTRRGSTLTIDDVQNSDAGRYLCVAENVGGATTSSVDVAVARKSFLLIINCR